MKLYETETNKQTGVQFNGLCPLVVNHSRLYVEWQQGCYVVVLLVVSGLLMCRGLPAGTAISQGLTGRFS